jgi:hypothetical protein
VRQSPASKDVNMEAEKATVLEDITRQQSVKNSRLIKLSACCSDL